MGWEEVAVERREAVRGKRRGEGDGRGNERDGERQRNEGGDPWP